MESEMLRTHPSGNRLLQLACDRISNTIEGDSGSQEISEKFKEVYKTLYNSTESANEVDAIKSKIKEAFCSNSANEANKDTMDCFKKACTRIWPGKSDVTGIDTIVLLLHGPDILFEYIACIFQSYLVHGNVALDLLSCAFIQGWSETSKSL